MCNKVQLPSRLNGRTTVKKKNKKKTNIELKVSGKNTDVIRISKKEKKYINVEIASDKVAQ